MTPLEFEAWTGDVVHLFRNGCRGPPRQLLWIDRMLSRHGTALLPLRLLILAALVTGGAAAAADQDVPAMLEQYRCTICHSDRETMAGPSWVDIAAEYRGKPKAEAKLAAVVKKGVHGGGPWPMPPLPEVPDADAKAIVHYILQQKR
jgi:cytochrome c